MIAARGVQAVTFEEKEGQCLWFRFWQRLSAGPDGLKVGRARAPVGAVGGKMYCSPIFLESHTSLEVRKVISYAGAHNRE
jgi:hypothetical protein